MIMSVEIKSYFYLHGAHNVLLMIYILDCMCHISLLMFLVTFLQLKENELSSCIVVCMS